VADCPGSAVNSLDCHNYRVTASAVGGGNATVMLQSTYSITIP
jgi:Tfp pilus assembly protein PilX